jgi:hypothetical protein
MMGTCQAQAGASLLRLSDHAGDHDSRCSRAIKRGQVLQTEDEIAAISDVELCGARAAPPPPPDQAWLMTEMPASA